MQQLTYQNPTREGGGMPFWKQGFECNERSNNPEKTALRGTEVRLNIFCEWL